MAEFQDQLEIIRKRWLARGTVLAVAAVLTAFFVLAGGLSWWWAAAGLAGVLIWSAVSPADDHRQGMAATGSSAAAVDASTEGNSALWLRMLDGFPDAALVLSGDGTVVAGNAAASAILAGAAGRHITHAQRAPELLTAIDRARITGVAQTFNLQINVPVERHLSGTATPLGGSAARPDGLAVLLILRDRTEAESLAQMRADFVANASHELRTPLASLKGFIETLQGAAKDDPAARERFLGIMQEQAARMSRLIEDLLSLSRIEMREHLHPTGRVDLTAVVREVARSLGPMAEAAGIAMAVEAGGSDAIVIGDRNDLEQVAQNLIQNAIKYGRRGGRVDVTLTRERSRIALQVKDDGIGIAREHLPRLTERFYRVSAKESRERGGTGLGLALVKHIINRHRGELRIESELGRGSTFQVILPTEASEQSSRI